MPVSTYNILVVDDDEHILELLKDFIASKGYRVDTASNGKSALSELGSHVYDLVLVDLNLPDMDGVDLVKWISRNAPETITVILSGYATLESAIEVISLGAFDFLVKPVELAKLNIVLDNGLERRKILLQNKKLISDLQIAKKDLQARVRQRTEQLKKSQEKFRELYDNAPDVYYTVDLRGIVIDCNKMACEFFGYNKKELLGKHLLDLYTSDNFELISCMVPTVDGKDSQVRHQEVQVKRADGTVAWVEINTNILNDQMGQILGSLTLQRDITDRKNAEKLLRENEERYRTIFQIAEVALCEIEYSDLKSEIDDLREKKIADFASYFEENDKIAVKLLSKMRLVDANDAALRLFSATYLDEIQANIRKVLTSECQSILRDWLTSLGDGIDVFESETCLRSLKGEFVHVMLSAASPPDSANFRNLLVSLVDITDRKKNEQEKDILVNRLHDLNKELERLAVTDGLTNLYNHRFFMESLSREFSRSRRSNNPLALLMADIDNFKSFNDTYGHQLGDEVLSKVAAALSSSRRGSDIVARYGGEEFVLLLPDTDLNDALKLAEKLRKRVSEQEISSQSGEVLKVTISMGAHAFDDDNVDNPVELLGIVDKALYKAKDEGKNRVCTLTPEEMKSKT